MTDRQIIENLIRRDGDTTQDFFFKKCRPLFISIINKVFTHRADYDECVNELYVYLMEDDARRLRQFQGRSSIYQWLKVTAIRFFIARRKRLTDSEAASPLYIQEQKLQTDDVYTQDRSLAHTDMNRLLESMSNRRYAYVLQRLILDDAGPDVVAEELSVTTDNLYNIKRRAIAALTQVVLNESGQNGRQKK